MADNINYMDQIKFINDIRRRDRNKRTDSFDYKKYKEQYEERERKSINEWDSNSEKRKKLNDLKIEQKNRIKEIDEEINEIEKKIADGTLKQAEGNKQQAILLEERKEKLNEFYKTEKDINNLSGYRINKAKEILNIAQGIVNGVNRMMEPWAKIDQAASNYAKNIGLSAVGMKALRDETLKTVATNKLAIKYNVSADELIRLQEGYIRAAGRNIAVSASGQEDIAAMSRVMGDNATKMLGAMDNFGLSTEEIASRSGKMFKEATKYGLSFDVFSKNVADNLRMAQNYQFRDGLKGLEQMAKQASEVKLNMYQVFMLADKLQTVEGAMDIAAKVQVLGGNFSRMADPIALLNESWTDIASLQKRVLSSIEGLGYYNEEKGQLDMGNLEKQQLKALSNATGIDYTQLMDTAYAKARREEMDKRIKASGRNDFTSDFKEILKNRGEFKEGKAGIVVDGEFKSLDQISAKDQNSIIAKTQSDSDNIRDIAIMLRDWYSTTQGFGKQVATSQAKITSFLGDTLKQAISIAGGIGILTTILALGRIGGAFSQPIGNISRMFKNGRLNRNMRSMSSATESISGNASAATRGGGVSGFFKKTPWAKNIGTGKFAQSAIGKSLSGWSIGKMLTRGGIAGLAGWGVGALKDNMMENGTISNGSVGDFGMSIAEDALTYGGLGAIAGIPGMIAGGVIGVVTGAIKAGKRNAESKMNKIAESYGLELNGKYSNSEIAKITGGLATGKISDQMRANLIENGDVSLLNKIDELKKNEKASPLLPDKIREMNLTADNVILKANNNPYASSIEPKKMTDTGNDSIIRKKENITKNVTERNEMNLSVGGTIRLEGMNGKQVDITDRLINQLLSNNSFIQNLTNKIAYQSNVERNGAFNKTTAYSGNFA